MAGYVAQNILEGVMTPFYAEDVAGIPADAIRLDVRKPRSWRIWALCPALSTSRWTSSVAAWASWT